MSERTNERDVGVGGETSALNFREDTHTGGTNERTNERRRAFLFHIRTVLGSGEDKFGETHRGHKPGRQAGRLPVALWLGEMRTHTRRRSQGVRKPCNDCRGEHSA